MVERKQAERTDRCDAHEIFHATILQAPDENDPQDKHYERETPDKVVIERAIVLEDADYCLEIRNVS